MTITVNEKTRHIFPASIRRQAGIKTGDQLEIKVSGGIITLLPKLPSADEALTAEQRRVIETRAAEGIDDVKHGRVHGPFDTHQSMIAFLHAEVKKAKSKKNAKPKAR
jgi:AbrB family looped-hinge helix DNA binding protein